MGDLTPAEYSEYLRREGIEREVGVIASSRNSGKSKKPNTTSKKEEKEKKDARTGSQDPPPLDKEARLGSENLPENTKVTEKEKEKDKGPSDVANQSSKRGQKTISRKVGQALEPPV